MNKSTTKRRRIRKKPVSGWIQVSILAILLVGLFVLLKKSDFVSKMFANILSKDEILSYFVTIFIVMGFLTNVCFAFAYNRYCRLLDDDPAGFASSIVPIWTDFNLIKVFESSECVGTLPIITLIFSVIKSAVAWGGMVFVYVKYGFLYFYEPHTYWLVGTFIVYALYVILKAITLGVIGASYDNELTFRFPGSFYKKHFVYLAIMVLYFIVITPISAWLKINIPFLKSSLVNFITIIWPLITPLVSAVDSCIVCSQVERALEADEEEEDYYED